MTFVTLCFRMLEFLYSGCTAVATGVQMFIDALRCLARLNSIFVATVVEAVLQALTSMVYAYCQVRQVVSIATLTTAEFLQEVSAVAVIFLSTLWKSIIYVCDGFQTGYANVAYGCLVCCSSVSAGICTVIQIVVFIYDCLVAIANFSTNLAIVVVVTVFAMITTMGSYCVGFVTGVWQGLGFVLSSVAVFPTNCVQSLKNVWMKTLEALTNVLTVTTKETYLGIVVLCLVYLMLSNALHFLYSKDLPLFPRRVRRQRNREHATNWQFDRGFESDYDDLYSSDTEDVSWTTPVEAANNDTDDDSDEGVDDRRIDQDSNHSANHSDDDEGSNSEEYTVATEESDSDASINSHTFSTESSDHEIEVQLPPADKCTSMCSRLSTPSRVTKTVTPEEFDREMERERDKRKCVVCQDQIKSVLILPCRHMCMCVFCAGQIARSRTIGQRVCPLCRTRITKVMNVYV